MKTSISTKEFAVSAAQFEGLLTQLQRLPGFIFLDSADQKSPSYCVWHPVYTLETYGPVTQIHDHFMKPATAKSSSADPFELIETYLRTLWPHTSENQDAGFCGGAFGYWGYELGGRIERLPSPKSHELTVPDMSIGIYDCALSYKQAENKLELRGQTTRFNDFVVFVEDAIASYNDTQTRENSRSSLSFNLTSPWRANMTKAQYAEKFNCVKEHLAAGNCYQINLAQRFDADYQGDEWLAYLTMRASNKAPFSSFMRLEHGAVLSLSPERFLQVKGQDIETKPIKGTRPRSLDPVADKAAAEDLQVAEKDRAENLMIVDLLRNDLSKVAMPGSVAVPKLFAIESYPAVHHLVSTVIAKLKPEYTALDLLRGAFPGGSITGAPKISAMQVIHDLEPHPRSVYCGAIGYILPNGDMDTNITIRTLVCNNNKIVCWAGGGLVADSEINSEYQETLDKVNKILPILESI